MLDFVKKNKVCDLYSAVNGQLINLCDVPDPAFSSGMMGPGVAYILEDHMIYSPCDGELIMFFPTKHAFGLRMNNGAEILIHIGLNTVEAQGKGFKQLAAVGTKIKKGDPILEVDVELLQSLGYSLKTPMIITNAQNYFIEERMLDDSLITTDDLLYSLKRKK